MSADNIEPDANASTANHQRQEDDNVVKEHNDNDASELESSQRPNFQRTLSGGPRITVSDTDAGSVNDAETTVHEGSIDDDDNEKPTTKAGTGSVPPQVSSQVTVHTAALPPSNDPSENGQDGHSSADSVNRARSVSVATTARSLPVSSTVFVVNALETISGSKEARKSKDLGDAVQAALANIRNTEQQVNPELIFRPLQMATKSYNVQLQVTALDCIGKLISYSYFAFPTPAAAPPNPADTPPLIERAIEAICDTFEGEATANEIQQQIIKSLLAAVLDDKIVVHGAGLLKAVRQIYNVFIYSKSSQNQQVAQGSLTQMVATVFERVRFRLDLKESRLKETAFKSEEDLPEDVNETESPEVNGTDDDEDATIVSTPTSTIPEPQSTDQKMTLQDFETTKTLDDTVIADAPTTVTRARRDRKNTRGNSLPTSRNSMQEDLDDQDLSQEDEDEIYLRDAFLVFRSLCKLSQKQLTHDLQQDLRSANMRSKLISLHLIHHVLNNYTPVFNSPHSVLKGDEEGRPLPFIQIAKPHLCLTLSRNAASSVSRVYEVCCEIFWLSLKHLRVAMKKELEVFWKEVYLAVLDKRSAPLFQKQMIMDVMERLSGDARALVEIYLNYDCDRTALDNMYQEIIEHLSRICSTPITTTAAQQMQFQEQSNKPVSGLDWHSKGALFPSLATTNMIPPPQQPSQIPPEYALKQQALRSLVEILSSLDNWSTADTSNFSVSATSRASRDESRDSFDHSTPVPPSPRIVSGSFDSGVSTPIAEDDPAEIEKVRKRKTALNDAIRQFNFKPKRGVKAFIEHGFVKTNSPVDVAQFLITNDRLDKGMLGEYLGEGDEYNIAVMHAFVDTMEFKKRRFVDALRQFLQSFRLPGEAQKIDRFMLKFAERYLTGNPNAFANADTAYVLAYSVIMLNTDQHSIKIKGKRMTPEDFIKNNRGINDGQDLPPDYLTSIFEEIANNEIVLNSEREQAEDQSLPTTVPAGGLALRTGQALANFGRDLQAERQAVEADKMAERTEQLFRTLVRAQRKSAVREALSKFVPASNIRHVGSMFSETWMSFLSALSSQMQDAQNMDLIQQCLEGLRLAIKITCRFDLDTPRTAFVTTLAKFTNLGNIKEMMAKNLQALRVLIDVAISEGDLLKGAWREILMCISQLDRLHLLSTGVDEHALPDVTRAQMPTPSNVKHVSQNRRSMQGRRPGTRPTNSFRPEVADETKSSEMIRGVDQIFTNTAKLSAVGIVDFVQALTDVSWQEIQSSGNSDSPRMYSLQKLVEISYYNMTRVRIEWSKIWDVLGDHFNQVGSHNNTAVVFFALDSLRQLSMRFMELEELPGFKFQKDFLKPFEYVMANNPAVTVKDMVLRCLIQMIQARGDNIRSGWKTMFGVFSVAAVEQYEAIVNIAFDYTTQIYNSRFGVVISQGSFPDLILCLKEFSKNLRFQKKSLQAIELLKSTVPKMLRTPECPLSRKHMRSGSSINGIQTSIKQPSSQTQEEQFWYPVLMAYQDVLMTGEDLEVRSRSLNYLFETLTKYGGDFPKDFWETLWRQVLYPIFVVLQSKSEMSKAPNHEELSVWLSTTMIQALRNMISLFTHYFDSLEHMLDRFLELLSLCICQENDTIARIGSNCLQQLILQNVTRFNAEHWARIVGAFVDLFNRTTAYELFSAAATMSEARPSATTEASEGLAMSTASTENSEKLITNGDHGTENAETSSISAAAGPTVAQTGQGDLEDYKPHLDMQTPAPVVTAARRRFFNKIITNCVLQLLMIETVAELFSNDSVYAQIPSNELLRLMGLLKKSYQFAKKFNGDKDLRMALWRQGFMRQPPNLLKQESGSANTYVGILMRMYHDEGEERRLARAETEGALIPLCADIIRSFIYLDDETQQRNIVAWRPVVIDVIEGYTNFPMDGFIKHIDTFYPLVITLLEKEVNNDLRGAIWGFLRRTGEARFGMSEHISSRGREGSISSERGTVGLTPISPGAYGGQNPMSRRASRVSAR